MIGYRAENPRHAFAIEGSEHGRRKFDFAPARAETAQYETGRNVWVTPGMPFRVYILAGYVVTVLAGSLIGL
jgi:preflagellin peptidase FlaK